MHTRRPSRAAPIVLFMLAPGLFAQETVTFKQEELEQLVAPIALYPDSLVAQILMASTYPLEVVQAERFAAQNANLDEAALTELLDKQNWDASVKSLVNFPQVLTMMSEQLDWTTKLGDAVLAQQKEVMNAIQRLRVKAKENGNLDSNEQQKVIVEQAPPPPADAATTTTTTTVHETIIIESADPEVVYVPSYNPTVVYGGWPYPAYPPYAYYPPGYVATAAVSWGLGVATGVAWAHAWGDCDWGHGDIDIDARSFESNRINSSRNTNIGNRNTNRQNGGKWQHDPSHRKGTAYRDQKTADRFGGQSSRQASQARDSFRGRAEAGRQDLARGGADQFRGQGAGSNRAGAGNRQGASAGQMPANRQSSGNRAGSGMQNRSAPTDRSRQPQTNRPSTSNREAQSSRPSQSNRSAFDGAGQGSSARQDSQRGQSSRQASRSSGSGGRSSASRGGGSRGGGSRGGMSRGGGARGGGGRGGRR